MNGPGDRLRQVLPAVLWLATLSGAPSSSLAEDFARAERLFADHCAVCHGVDRGGYIGPALNSEQTKLTRDEVAVKILTGGGTTLMPQHPTWRSTLSSDDRDLLASLITKRPRQSLSWGLEDIRKSLEVFVADESTLPAKPTYRIGSLDDLMAVMARGDFLYVSARAGGDRPADYHRDRLVIYDARTLNEVKAVPLEVPAGVFSHARARAVVVGLGSTAR